jgi:SNF family Na+-dependent transporter
MLALLCIVKPYNFSTHVSFSLSIGFGGMIALASYNPRNHNCYKDAALVTIADAVSQFWSEQAISLILGYVSFGWIGSFFVSQVKNCMLWYFCRILGFMSAQLKIPISKVVQSGTGVAFIAYPVRNCFKELSLFTLFRKLCQECLSLGFGRCCSF